MIEQGRIKTLFDIDFERGIMLWRIPPKYHPRMMGREAGCERPTSKKIKAYWVIKIDGYPYKRAALVFAAWHGYWPRPCVDHIDGNSLNDALNNLRAASAQQNSWNHKTRNKSEPTPMGVRRLRSGRFQARIAKDNKQIAIGSFDTEEDARSAYERARKELYGQFA